MQGAISEPDYWPWIRELTRRKQAEQPDEAGAACRLAARENRATGVWALGEHSDRPFSASAMRAERLEGLLWQEVITFLDRDDPEPKLAAIEAKAAAQSETLGRPVTLTPHATYTVDRVTLGRWRSGGPYSIHAAETELERAFLRDDAGPIADLYRAHGLCHPGRHESALHYLDSLGLLRPGAQIVHACDVTLSEVGLLAERQVTVAHCPRSNARLGCPVAPVRRMLDAGIAVGLGMDSAASSGPIDMFAEMRAALSGPGLEPGDVWRMATELGAASLGRDAARPWPLIMLDAPLAKSVGDLIEGGQPSWVRWVEV
jgi:5-methylthioadenosine/S-adenosylhomocysteine deaminase